MPELVVPTAGAAATRSGDPARRPALIVVRNDDLRLLVRGILTLSGHRVVQEHREVDALSCLEGVEAGSLLVLDVGDGTGEWAGSLASAVRAGEDLRAIVIVPGGDQRLRAMAVEHGARATVGRPLVLSEFLDALAGALGPGGGRP